MSKQPSSYLSSKVEGRLKADESGNSTLNTAEIIVAKHRNGPLDTVKATFIGRYAKFADFDEFGKDDTFEANQGDNKSIYKKFSSKANDDVDVERKHRPEEFDTELPPF